MLYLYCLRKMLRGKSDFLTVHLRLPRAILGSSHSFPYTLTHTIEVNFRNCLYTQTTELNIKY